MSSYLKPNRLQDIIGAIQIMGSHQTYKMSIEEWQKVIENSPLSAPKWDDVFRDHPEFFRKNNHEQYSIMWRKGLQYVGSSRAPLDAAQTRALLDLAVGLHTKAEDNRRDKRWWVPIGAAILAAVIGFTGAVTGAYWKSDSGATSSTNAKS